MRWTWLKYTRNDFKQWKRVIGITYLVKFEHFLTSMRLRFTTWITSLYPEVDQGVCLNRSPICITIMLRYFTVWQICKLSKSSIIVSMTTELLLCLGWLNPSDSFSYYELLLFFFSLEPHSRKFLDRPRDLVGVNTMRSSHIIIVIKDFVITSLLKLHR